MEWLRLALLGFILIFQTTLVACTHSRTQADDRGILSTSITSNGLVRAYLLYLPSTYHQSTAVPLVVALHGGGGHTWPGGYQYLPEFLIGRTSRDFKATSIIWNFFNAHPK
jgi:poly(3-hydroxybutyrate) depolymerase